MMGENKPYESIATLVFSSNGKLIPVGRQYYRLPDGRYGLEREKMDKSICCLNDKIGNHG